MRYWVSAVLLVLGIVGVAFGYPLRATPTAVDVSFAGSYTSPGVVAVTEPGPHTVWEAGSTRHDGNLCRISGPDGAAIPVTSSWPIRWSVEGDAVDTYTAIGAFDAPRAGDYRIECSVDPKTPGTSFAVSTKPSVVRSVLALVGGAVAILGAAVVAVLVWRRRRVAVAQNGGSS